MAENPLTKLARVLGGVALMQGRLGHQVLGQMLILDSSEVAVAGANIAVAAFSGRRNAAAQVAVRTGAPAIAVSAIVKRQERRLEKLSARLAQREERLLAREKELEELFRQFPELKTGLADLKARLCAECETENIRLRGELSKLEAEKNQLTVDLGAREKEKAEAVDQFEKEKLLREQREREKADLVDKFEKEKGVLKAECGKEKERLKAELLAACTKEKECLKAELLAAFEKEKQRLKLGDDCDEDKPSKPGTKSPAKPDPGDHDKPHRRDKRRPPPK